MGETVWNKKYPLCLGNISKDFTATNMINLDMSSNFLLNIISLVILLIFVYV